MTKLIHINQDNRDKQNLEKKWEMLIKKILVATTVLNSKVTGINNKILDTSCLVTATVLDTKLGSWEQNP